MGMCLSCVKDTNMPYAIRMAFTDLLRILYVDAWDNQPVAMPNFFWDMRVIQEKLSLPANSNPGQWFLIEVCLSLSLSPSLSLFSLLYRHVSMSFPTADTLYTDTYVSLSLPLYRIS